MSPEDVEALDDRLRALHDEIKAGRLDATDQWRTRLEGAVIVLGVILGREDDTTPLSLNDRLV